MKRPCGLSLRDSSFRPERVAVEAQGRVDVGDADHRVQVFHGDAV